MFARAAVDSAPPPPPPSPPAYVYAATDERPRTPEEQKLCAKASDPDWLYLGALVALDAGAVVLDWDPDVQNSSSGVVRFTGPVALGLDIVHNKLDVNLFHGEEALTKAMAQAALRSTATPVRDSE